MKIEDLLKEDLDKPFFRAITERLAQTPERRTIVSEFRASDTEDVIEGYPAVFNRSSVPLWFGTEEIAAGAFADTIAADDIRALFNHEPNLVIGRNTAKTLTLREDSVGLNMNVNVAPTTYGKDLMISTRRKDVTQGSIGFRTLDDSWAMKDGEPHRTLRKVKLYDVSPVTFPAYPDTDVSARSEVRALVAFSKLRAKISLSREDVTAVEEAVGNLRGVLPGSEVVVDKLQVARRRLRLAEARRW